MKGTNQMSMRVRRIHKVKKGTYITSSHKVSTIIWINILYFIFIFPFVLLIKYGIIFPIKWIINKVQSNKDKSI